MSKRTTIFRQLIFNVVLPAIIALILLGAINYQHTRGILLNASKSKNLIIIDEIVNIHEMQDMALEILEEELKPQMQAKSNQLVIHYFKNTDGIDTVDLKRIRAEMKMNEDLEDIYVINRMGVIVNSTFDADRNLKLFDFGDDHKKMIESVFDFGEFVNEKFAVENKTKRLKKFTYQSTLDGKYIIELGIYSEKADNIITAIKRRINSLSAREENFVSVDLFIGSENPFSLNQEAEILPEHISYYQNAMERKTSIKVTENVAGKKLDYHYIYVLRKNTSLYSESILRIISDRTAEQLILRQELFKFFVFFGITMFIVIILLYRKTRVITDPIKNLVESVNRITDGHLTERAEITGNNEIASLSEQFNRMIEQLESYYYELEEKVRLRTAEILSQKEEIEAQRDAIQEQRNVLSEINSSLQKAYSEIEEQKKHIEDSIHYARRIQNAILPPDDYVKKLIPQSFILYKPKDIVSGDFYWLAEKKSKVFVAAVDCTGHGVPGAFMSIVGNNQLNYAVNVRGITRPSEILDSINEGVTKTLRQTRLSTSVRDGMDMSLISIDKSTSTLEYAGAFNPLLIVRDNQLIKLEPNKFAVGGYMGEKLHVFSNQVFKYQKDDMLYMFSDGYSDQFGGESDSKFMIKRFRELLLRIHHESIEDQKDILEFTHTEWRGHTYQVDDILVIGIRF
jgi:phosphoserine phosphatase RsbU/P